MPSIAALAPVIHVHLTDTAEAAARQTGCVQRVRQFSGATLVQTCVLGFLEAPDASLSALCQMAALRGVTITPQGLAQRFTPALAATLHLVLAALVSEIVVGPAVTIPLLQRFGQVWVLDTTVIRLPDELAPLWAGCGGQAGRGRAALKVALDLELVRGQLAGPAGVDPLWWTPEHLEKLTSRKESPWVANPDHRIRPSFVPKLSHWCDRAASPNALLPRIWTSAPRRYASGSSKRTSTLACGMMA